ncbi:hypothetical protein JR065_11040 [Xanthomonas sp. AmX2]|uniref:hypothetical protein n=1 Tax=Xanthomonas sp. TaxID=29446 RepID=UPI0019800351|nr:hypothetical protein [Xanthomonas sp.]MBN6150878.1 hypothetical protein [Xanthomonas sp.]
MPMHIGMVLFRAPRRASTGTGTGIGTGSIRMTPVAGMAPACVTAGNDRPQKALAATCDAKKEEPDSRLLMPFPLRRTAYAALTAS